MDSESDGQMASEQEDEDELSRFSRSGFVSQPRNALDALADVDDGASESLGLDGTDDNQSSISADWQHQLSAVGDMSDTYDQVVDSLPQHCLEVRIEPMLHFRDYPTFWYDPTVEQILEEYEVKRKSRYLVVKGDGAEEEVGDTFHFVPNFLLLVIC